MKFNLIYFLDSADKPFSIFVQIYLVNTSPKKEVNMLPPQPLYGVLPGSVRTLPV